MSIAFPRAVAARGRHGAPGRAGPRRPGPAQSSKPAKKDSSPRTRPKDVVLTPSVTPAEARPGDTVVYKVTAKLAPGWHIYTYAKDQQDEGPRKTRFDLFDTGGPDRRVATGPPRASRSARRSRRSPTSTRSRSSRTR